MRLMKLHTIFEKCRPSSVGLMSAFSATEGFRERNRGNQSSKTTRDGGNRAPGRRLQHTRPCRNAAAPRGVGPAGRKVIFRRLNVMKAVVVMVAVLLMGALRPEPANAWATANRWGGSTSHTWGATSHTNAWGGSSSHAYGVGTDHTNMYGGSSAHAWGGGTEHTNAYGGGTLRGVHGAGATHTYASGATAYHPPGYGGYGYSAYHPPGYGYRSRTSAERFARRQPARIGSSRSSP